MQVTGKPSPALSMAIMSTHTSLGVREGRNVFLVWDRYWTREVHVLPVKHTNKQASHSKDILNTLNYYLF